MVTESKILGDAEALANLQGEFPPTEGDFRDAEAEVRAHVAETGNPYFTEED